MRVRMHTHTHIHIPQYTHRPIHTDRQTDRQTDRHTHTHSRVKSKQKLIIGYQMRQTRRLESRMIWNQIQICPRYIRVTWDSSLLWVDCVHCHGEDQNSNLSWGDCTLPSIAKIRISICPGVPLQNAIGKIEFQSALEWLHTALGGDQNSNLPWGRCHRANWNLFLIQNGILESNSQKICKNKCQNNCMT